MVIKGLIFDLDGVIVFTDKLHYIAWKRMTDKLGIYFDEEINHRLRGVSRVDSLEIILERLVGRTLSQEQKQELLDEKNSYYRELLDRMTPEDVSDEVRNTLRELRQRGYQLAIGSSSKNAGLILEKVNLLEYFDAISDGNNILKSKPDPEVFLKGAEYIGLLPEECAVIEDASAGIDAAKAGNMLAIAIGDATNNVKADMRLLSFRDLLTLLPSLQIKEEEKIIYEEKKITIDEMKTLL